jgi:hypothetical protein
MDAFDGPHVFTLIYTGSRMESVTFYNLYNPILFFWHGLRLTSMSRDMPPPLGPKWMAFIASTMAFKDVLKNAVFFD